MAETEKEALTAISIFKKEDTVKKFQELLGPKKAAVFITTILSVVAQNDLLKNAEPKSVYMAGLIAASLDLPVNTNLGFAYIVPYKKEGIYVAQFQMGYKGFIQLSQRSGQFKTIGAAAIREGQIVSTNPLTGFEFDFTQDCSDKPVIGYAGYFKLLNGFEKVTYMKVEDLNKHGQKFSKSYKHERGLWKTDFDGMAQKTVLKLLLSKYAPMSIDMQRAVIGDQSLIKDAETMDVEYIDNDKTVSLEEAIEGFTAKDPE